MVNAQRNAKIPVAGEALALPTVLATEGMSRDSLGSSRALSLTDRATNPSSPSLGEYPTRARSLANGFHLDLPRQAGSFARESNDENMARQCPLVEANVG